MSAFRKVVIFCLLYTQVLWGEEYQYNYRGELEKRIDGANSINYTCDQIGNRLNYSASANSYIPQLHWVGDQIFILPQGIETEYWFQWGTDENLGNESTKMTLAYNNSAHLFEPAIPAAGPGTTYHLRVLAENPNGVVSSEIYTWIAPFTSTTDLQVSHTGMNASYFPGLFSFQVAVRNNGSAAQNVVVKSKVRGVSSGVEISGADSVETSGPWKKCSLGDLPAGASRVLNFTVIAPEKGWVYVSSIAISDNFEHSPDDNKFVSSTQILPVDTDNDGIFNEIDLDDDGDGIPDSEEAAMGLDLLNADDANEDQDGDGYTNLQEYKNKSDFADANSVPKARMPVGWEWKNPSPTNAEFLAVASNGTTAVAVGEEGLIFTRNEYGNWKNIRSDTTQKLHDIIWADGRYVVVGDKISLTSNDGFIWQKKTQQEEMEDIIWTGNYYIAIAESYSFTSIDGLTWQTFGGAPFSWLPDYQCMVWAGDKALVINIYGKIFSSSDGESWTLRFDGQTFEGEGESIGWNGTIASVHGEGSTTHLTSSDGINWNQADDEFYGNINSIINDNGLLIAVGGNDNGDYRYLHMVRTSTDGINWEYKSYDSLPQMTDICIGPDGYIAVGQRGLLAESDDLTSWKRKGPDRTYEHLSHINYINGKFYAVGDKSRLLTSLDGDNWETGVIGYNADLTAILNSNTTLLAVAESGLLFISNDNGDSWTEKSSDISSLCKYALWSGDKFIIGGSNDGNAVIATSSDGIDWQSTILGPGEITGMVKYDNKILVYREHQFSQTSGPTLALHTTIDCITWESTWAAGRNPIKSSDGKLYKSGFDSSEDGVNWIKNSEVYFRDFLVEGPIIIGVGRSLRMSTDGGINWSEDYFEGMIQSTFIDATSKSFNSIAFGAGRYVAVGNHGAIAANSITRCDLKTEISTDSPNQEEGQDFNYRIKVTNFGPIIASDIHLTVEFDPGLDFQIADGFVDYTREGSILQGIIRQLDINDSTEVVISCIPAKDRIFAPAQQTNEIHTSATAIAAASYFHDDDNRATLTTTAYIYDADADGVPWDQDNAPFDVNPDQLDTDHDGVGNAGDSDDDNDGISDDIELANGMNPLVKDGDRDVDNDGATNLEEFQAGTGINDPDSRPFNYIIKDFSSPEPWSFGNIIKVLHLAGTTYTINQQYGIYASTDLENWTFQGVGPAGLKETVIKDGKFVLIKDYKYQESNDLVNWTNQNISVKGGNITWNGTQFLSFTKTSTYESTTEGTVYTYHYELHKSTDGLIWTEIEFADNSDSISPPEWVGNRYFATTYEWGSFASSTPLYTSTDGVSWQKTTYPTGRNIYTFSWNGNHYFGVGESANSNVDFYTHIIKSSDGINWSTVSTNFELELKDIAWSGSQFVAVGEGDYDSPTRNIATSSDGNSWTTHLSNGEWDYDGIVWTGSHFVAYSDSGTLSKSVDGVTWDELNKVVPNIKAFTQGNNEFAAFSNAAYTSPDGNSWTKVYPTSDPSDKGITFYDALWDGEKYVASTLR